MNNKLKFKNKMLIVITYIIVLLLCGFFNADTVFAADPKLINTLKGAFEKI